jgi:hypothetical protein
VSAAVMLIKDVASIITSTKYPNNGFGALVRNQAKGIQNVMVWGNRTDLFNELTDTFQQLKDIDPALASVSH